MTKRRLYNDYLTCSKRPSATFVQRLPNVFQTFISDVCTTTTQRVSNVHQRRLYNDYPTCSKRPLATFVQRLPNVFQTPWTFGTHWVVVVQTSLAHWEFLLPENFCEFSCLFHLTRGYQKVLSLTWKEPEIWIYSALFFNVVPFQLHTLVPSSFPVINTRSVEVNILVP